jgi:hypothetical protein
MFKIKLVWLGLHNYKQLLACICLTLVIWYYTLDQFCMCVLFCTRFTQTRQVIVPKRAIYKLYLFAPTKQVHVPRAQFTRFNFFTFPNLIIFLQCHIPYVDSMRFLMCTNHYNIFLESTIIPNTKCSVFRVLKLQVLLLRVLKITVFDIVEGKSNYGISIINLAHVCLK